MNEWIYNKSYVDSKLVNNLKIIMYIIIIIGSNLDHIK